MKAEDIEGGDGLSALTCDLRSAGLSPPAGTSGIRIQRHASVSTIPKLSFGRDWRA